MEACRRIERITGDPTLDGSTIIRERLACIDADADLDPHVRTTDRSIEVSRSALHLQRRPDGPERVILVRGRHPEHADDRVADELLDRPAMPLDRRAHRPEVAAQYASQDLRVRPLGDPRGADQIAEQGRHDAATNRLFVCRESCTTRIAKPRSVWVRRAT